MTFRRQKAHSFTQDEDLLASKASILRAQNWRPVRAINHVHNCAHAIYEFILSIVLPRTRLLESAQLR